jgi:regulation of enolase protein 1 (concanavalin A-like superfamily)
MDGKSVRRGKLRPISFKDCTWLNEPATWSATANELKITTDARTDYWRETHYGFVRDNGHFLRSIAKGDFTAEIRFRAVYNHLYDQAGLMIRLDERHWVKTGIEFTDGECALSTVVTSGKSDWSVGKLRGDPGDVRLRVTVSNGALRIQASTDGLFWPLFRLAPFPESVQCEVGPMCCSPERAGFECQFSEFMIGPPTSKSLHDLS